MTIKVAIVGLGNCASALVQGTWKYNTKCPEYVPGAPGLMFDSIGDYTPNDLE